MLIAIKTKVYKMFIKKINNTVSIEYKRTENIDFS